jgi:tetratricopeptide (TPR) repeat protein
VPEDRNELAKLYYNLANTLDELDRFDEARSLYRQAESVWKRLADDYPDHRDYRNSWAGCLHNLGLLEQTTGRLAEAEDAYTRSARARETLDAARPDPALRFKIAWTHHKLGTLYSSTGRLDRALESFRTAVVLREGLYSAPKPRSQIRDVLADTHHELARVFRRLGVTHQNDLRKAVSRAIALRQEGVNLDADGLFALAELHSLLALSSADPAARDRALLLLKQAITAGFHDPDALRNDPDLDPLRMCPAFPVLVFDCAFPRDPFGPGR